MRLTKTMEFLGAEKQQWDHAAQRGATPRNSDAHERIAVPKALCVLRERPDQDPKAVKFAVLTPGRAGFPNRAKRSEGNDSASTRNAPCFAV